MYHVYSRGSNRRAIFAFDSDRADFLGCLDRVVRTYELSCLSYCLMMSHYHLLLQVPDTRLSQAMKALNGRYSLRFNRRYGRDAHLFKNRFGAVLQETDDQFRHTVRYILRNPVEAGLCAVPDEWPWSSYGAEAQLGRTPAFVDVGALLALFGKEPAVAMARYRELVESSEARFGV